MAPGTPPPEPRSPAAAAVLDEALRHMDALFRAALRMTRDPAEAEDLVQDTYLKAVRSAGGYREGAGVRAWLFRILTNAFIDRYRRRMRTPETVELSESGGVFEAFLEGRGDAAPDAPWTEAELDAFLWRFVGDEVKTALEDLPPAFRLAVILRDVEGFSYREIAGILGVPVGTVMSRLFRGRRALQASLAAYARSHGYSGNPAES